MKGFVICSPTSNCGKSTVAFALMRALTARGLRVQPFKCGPDYIDTMYHSIACGVDSVNLDTFMSSPEHVHELFAHYSADADVCVVEGAMGMYDGYDRDKGSSAGIAALLGLPVLLVVSAQSVAYSVAPLVHGFSTFHSEPRIAGVIFNKVASPRHYALLRSACTDCEMECLGYLPRDERLSIPPRHLGLTIEEKTNAERLIAIAAQEAEAHINIDRLLAL